MVGGGQRRNLTEVLRWKVAEVTWLYVCMRKVMAHLSPVGYLLVQGIEVRVLVRILLWPVHGSSIPTIPPTAGTVLEAKALPKTNTEVHKKPKARLPNGIDWGKLP